MGASYRDRRAGDSFEKSAKKNHKVRRVQWENDDEDDNRREWQDDKSEANEPQPAK